MAFGTKTNERPGTRASVRYLRACPPTRPVRCSTSSAACHVDDADGILEFTDRAVATDIRKVLASAVANAEKNDEIDPNELYVSACYADEGPTLRRCARARGRATRIRKRTCHITIIVSRMGAREARAAPGAHRGRRRPRWRAPRRRRGPPRPRRQEPGRPRRAPRARPRPRGPPHPRRGRQRRPDRGRDRRGRRRHRPHRRGHRAGRSRQPRRARRGRRGRGRRGR